MNTCYFIYTIVFSPRNKTWTYVLTYIYSDYYIDSAQLQILIVMKLALYVRIRGQKARVTNMYDSKV